MMTAISGMITAIIAESGTSWRSAMMMPPIIMIGARIMTLSIITTTIWTCCTSLVLRVMSDGAPKRFTSVCEKLSTWRKIAPRTSRPNAMAVFDPSRPTMTEATPMSSVTSDHDSALLPDVGGVALGHAVVDDVGVQVGQVQVRDRLHEQERDDDGELPCGRA